MSDTNQAMDDILSHLNPQQRQATCHGQGPLLIVAGAGTGKTMTLAHRVSHLIDTGINPGRILLLTFTRRAAAEMLRRVDGIMRKMQSSAGPNGSQRSRLTSRNIWGGTFHAIATRLLRQHGKMIGLDPGFTILDRGDAEDLTGTIRGDLGFAKTHKRFPLKGTCTSIYSRSVNSQQNLAKLLDTVYPWCREWADQLKELFQQYVDRKEAQASLDYDDLLLFWNALVAEQSAGDIIRKKFDCVLVDEYQDTNVLQASILKHLCPDGTGLTVVGDDAQSIYSFRAATVRNILDFPKQFPGTTIVTLEENYRSTQPILEAANHVIAYAPERHTKNLWTHRTAGTLPQVVCCCDDNEQTEFVVERILSHRETGTRLQQQAVLFRASHHSLSLEVELTHRNIPFHKYGGLKFAETAHVKDLVAYLRLAENPRDLVAANRVLLLLPGIGLKKARQLSDMLLSAAGDFRIWDDYEPPLAAKEDWPAFVTLLRTLTHKASKTRKVSVDVHNVRKFYTPLLEQRYDHADSRLRDLEQLEQIAARFPNRASFLSDIAIDPPSSTQDLSEDPLLDEDFLILSTIHSAKGLEWDTVFVIHAADGNIPSDMATGEDAEIEEERRLFYVALTRAKNHLYVCHPQRYYFHGRHRSDDHSYSQLTRFLPDEILSHFERRSAGMADGVEPEGSGRTALTTADIREQIKRSWL